MKLLITQKATFGTPDLVIEIVSPNDRKSDTNATEADYQTLGVLEIVCIDQRRRLVRILRKSPVGYVEQTLTGQPLTLRSLQNLTLEWDWLFVEPRPDGIDTCCPCSPKPLPPRRTHRRFNPLACPLRSSVRSCGRARRCCCRSTSMDAFSRSWRTSRKRFSSPFPNIGSKLVSIASVVFFLSQVMGVLFPLGR